MNELHAIKLKIELGRKRMALQREQEALEKKKRERESMGTLYTSIDKLKVEKSKEAEKYEIKQKNIQYVKTASKFIAAAAAVLMVVVVSMHVAKSVKDSKNPYGKFKMAMKPISNSESLEACDFAKKFVIEFSSRGESGVGSLWSKAVDSEAKSELEPALRRLNPSDVNFNSVEILPGMIKKVTGTHQGHLPVIFLLDSSPSGLAVRFVEVQM